MKSATESKHSLCIAKHIKYLLKALIALSLTFVLSACGGGGGSSDGDGDLVETSTVDEESDLPGDSMTDTETEDAPEQSIEILDEDGLQILSSGDTLSGNLEQSEFVTFRVPENAQVVLTSDTGDSDIFLFDSPGFAEEALVCADNTRFREDICSGNSNGDLLYATVLGSDLSNDYSLTVTDDCSVGNINQWVNRSMLDYYLFADQVPVVDPLDYDSPSDLVRDLRFNELDPFSGIGDAATRQALFEEGRTFGFGYRWGRDSDGDLRILVIDSDSPFAEAGVKRGDIFHSLGGVLDADLTDEQFFDFIGTVDEPRDVEWGFIDGETGELETFTTAQAEYTINTVAYTNVFTNPSFDGRTGYIVFNRFLNTSVDELDSTINQLIDRDITELVLDLRYNGGGRVFVAERLAAQISGNSFTGEVFSRTQYNDTYRNLNSQRVFQDAEPSLNLSRVVVLVTRATASASELLINSLRPYMEVVVIGDVTTGKPFQSFSRNFCGMSLDAMNSQLLNASEVSVAGGIGSMCFAQDDRTRNFGIGDGGIEGMLLSALDYVVFGTCDVEPSDTIASRNSLPDIFKDWEKTGLLDASGLVESDKRWPFPKQ